ncbi:hypothetical protein OESDEN_16888 [Oesophagostomum dentatum]|uniref:Major facilitator superfamily (MFS) profile domain-containing protein n=1 Tax=Oesophagostomum dentatum TaxID=61180 RepID=A0A0B1SJK2_OESDE|nr:hypothetical protein OESDEN_16888 [Oesophagostomum dentatum]
MPEKIYCRDFENNEIYAIGGVLFGISCVATLIFIALPTKRLPEEGEEFEKIDESTLRTQLARILDTAREPKMILLSAFFVFYGFHVTLLFGYPTTFAFTKMLSKNVYLQAYYSIMMGTGSLLAGVLIAFCDSHIKNFGLIPIQIMQIALSIVLYFLTIATTANLSTIQTVDDESMWIRPT